MITMPPMIKIILSNTQWNESASFDETLETSCAIDIDDITIKPNKI